MSITVTKSAKEPIKASKLNDASPKIVTQGVADLTVAEATKVKSKNLDVIREYQRSKPKNAANFVVIGMCICWSL